MPMILMLVTNQPDIAQEAQSAGIDRIFVDLEILQTGPSRAPRYGDICIR